MWTQKRFFPAARSKKTLEIITHLSAQLRSICETADKDISDNGLGCTKALEEALERALDKAGCDLIKALVSVDSSRIPGDEALPGESFVGKRTRTVEFVFGPVEISRNCYHHAERGSCRFPLDEALCLRRGMSPAVVARVSMQAALESFDEASDTCGNLTGAKISPDRIRVVAQSLREPAEAFLKNAPAPEKEPPKCVAVEVDGKGVPLRRAELKEAKGKAEDGKAKTQEVKVGAIFTFTPNPGEAEPPERNPGSTRYSLSLKKAGEFGQQLWAEFEKRFGKALPTTLFISDAASGILNIRADWFPFAVGIIDIQHATEHLNPVLEACGFAAKNENRHTIFKKWRDWLLAGKVADIIEEAQRIQVDKDACRKALHYFEEGKPFMKYAEYKAKGWFIGSGVIEAACKAVVAQRFSQSGMFWSRKGLEAMLPLRAIIKSKLYAEFWQYMLNGKRQIKCAA